MQLASRNDVDDEPLAGMLAWAALHELGLPGRARAAIRDAGGARAVLAAGAALVDELFAAHAPRAKPRCSIEAARAAADQLRPFIARGGVVLAEDAAAFGRLGASDAAPLCLYARGDVDIARASRSIAIVGARAATERGQRRAYELGRTLAHAGVLVVSGGARGIDAEAHRGAREGGGVTMAILGERVRGDGGDERPSRLLGGGVARLLAVTAYGPWVRNTNKLFVARNLFVAAAVEAVIVVEAGERSGTLSTALAAEQLKVPVWAIPGDVDDPLAATPNKLLAERRARCLLPGPDAARVLLGLAPAPAPKVASARPERVPPLVREVRAAGGALTVDAAARALSSSAHAVLADAMLLEMEGLLRREGANLIAPRCAPENVCHEASRWSEA
jgi:DNA processing protein